MKHINRASILLMAAAPLDFEPEITYATKIDKHSIKSIPLKLCPDILKKVSMLKERPFTVGFAAEAGLNVDRAKLKFQDKRLDMIVLNDIMQQDRGMESDANEVMLIYKKRNNFFEEQTSLLSKDEIASIILSKILELKLAK